MTRAARTMGRAHHSIAAAAAFAGCLLVARVAPAASSVEKLQEFSLDQVQVTDAYYQNLFTKDVNYLITTLNYDRLLAPFKAVGQGKDPTTASGLNLYGGWEAASSLIKGHSLGHHMSALAHGYQQALGSDATLASQIKTKIDYIITQLQSAQASNGYLFATTTNQFDVVEGKATGNQWVPWYTMHKIVAGLVDIYKFEGNPAALSVASKLGDWIYARVSGWDSATRSRVLGVEYGGMNDCLYELYKYTNVANHLTAAHIFDETNLFTTIAAGTDNLNGVHANMTIPKFLGALNRYQTVGASEMSYFTAADQFLTIVLNNHTYVTGGNSQDEHFRAPGKLDATRDNLNNESCNAYNMAKLGRELFKVTGDVKYADYYERVHINEVLSAMNPSTGMTTYFKPMGTGYFKAYGTADSTFRCCNGTGTENYTKLGDSLYFHDATDLYVIGYVSSTLNWKDRGLALTQTTDLPLTNKVTFTVTAAPADAVNIKFRTPYWLAACQSVSITVNGQAVTPVKSGGFLGVSQMWKAGDKIEVTLPMEVQVSRLQDNQNAVAFTYGPVVLSAGLGTAQMVTAGHALTIMATTPAGVTVQDTITINSGTTINSWLANIRTNLVQTPGKLEFTPKNTDSDSKLTFTPQYQRYQDRYGIYFKLAGTAGATVTPPACPAAGTGGVSGGAGGATGGGGFNGRGGNGGAIVIGTG
ncbi:MAG: beta-L-arabinofuranosidase domain-containing protein, partial [Pseudomonadota bacterium]